MTNSGLFRHGWDDEQGSAPARPRPSASTAARRAAPAPATSNVHPLPAMQWAGWPPGGDAAGDVAEQSTEPDTEDAEPAAAAAPRTRETATSAAGQEPSPQRPQAPVEAVTAQSSVRPPDGGAGEWRPASVDLSHDTLTRHRGDVPQSGWRRAVYRRSGGLINPGIGETERARQLLRARVQRPLHQSRRIAVISVKGGIGKTTTTACLGMALAEIRGDQVSVIDGNPDAGTLADRLTGNTSVTIRHLLRNIDSISTLTEVSSYMSLAGRLKVLASDQDPAVSDALTADEYEKAINLLGQFFNIMITDSGTGISHPTMEPTLRMADSLVVVGSATIDGASRAGHTLDWLDSHGLGAKARNAIVVLSGDRSSQDVDQSRIISHFATRVRAVVNVPADPHLAAGGRIEFERLRMATRDAYTTVAAHIADQFPDRQD
ncbi:MinD/ParA family ATP-binding protein [Pseudonocardia sp. D17]|uniref:MinD/ParA family ATP-binding protein n=1 Tax=Pseudonocardia sp. D17 TaxID=882661 RepID=UPI002B3D7982|nr:ATPase [Pseudonocardia sp. D17]